MLFNLSQRSILLNRSGNLNRSIITFNKSIRKASTIAESNDNIQFKLPTTETEVAELLASTKTPQERREIFQTLLGIQKPIPLPNIPKSETGSHLIPIGRKKLTTDYVGIHVHHSPFEVLKETYQSTLKVLQNFPNGSIYRQSVESLTKQKLESVMKNELGEGSHNPDEIENSIKTLEVELGVNLVEEAIDQAKDEHSLTLSLYDSEAWSDLIEKPSPGQWDSFTIPSSTSYPKN